MKISKNINFYGYFGLDLREIDEHIENKNMKKERLVENLKTYIIQTQDNWIHFKLLELFGRDPDLYWSYEFFKRENDIEALKELFIKEELRVVKQSGQKHGDKFLTHLYKGNKLLGVHELFLNTDWNEKI